MKIVPADDMPMPLEAFAPNTSFAPFRFYRSTGKSDVEG